MSSNFAIYLLGYSLLTAGIAFAMYSIGLASHWIIAAVLVMVGLGVVAALTRSKRTDMTDAKIEQTEQQTPTHRASHA